VCAREIADTTLTIPHPYPDGAAEAWIATLGPGWEAGKSVTYAVVEAARGALVGAVGLALTPAHAAAELGYWVAVPAWGRGYATEAAGALCEYAFAALGVHRIQARHFVRNPASGRVMQKLGMRCEGVLRAAVRKWDKFEDLALYAVFAPEWEQRVRSASPPHDVQHPQARAQWAALEVNE
jgi:RimJ/RimL family protein N-acetyltransferase